MLCNNSKERRSLLHHGGSLKLHMKILFPVNELNYLTSIFGKYGTDDKIIYCKVHLFICYEFPSGKVNAATPLRHSCYLPLLFKLLIYDLIYSLQAERLNNKSLFAEYKQQDATFHNLFISVRRST